MAGKNPIEARVDLLSDQWVEFAEDPDARVLRWVLKGDEIAMAEAFLQVEGDPEAGNQPDFFLELVAPFENPQGHGFFLRQALVAVYEEFSEQADEQPAEQGEAADWKPPVVDDRESDIQFLVRTCESFHAHHELPGHLVLVLRPTAVDDPGAYQLWLHRLAVAAPAQLRALVLDSAEAPGYGQLAEADPRRVTTRAADLDMPSALEQVSAEAGHLDTPGGKFRHLFVQLGNALGEQDLGKALSLGGLALQVAASQGWHHLAVPVHFALGGSLTGAGRHQEAVNHYTEAETAAVKGQSEGPDEAKDACKKLQLQARLGRAAALMAGGAHPMAARLYEESAPMAAEGDDPRVLLDCWRLASFSHEQAGAYDDAWRCGLEGLRVARDEMDAETRQSSSFPYLGEGLMRLCERPERKGLARQTELEIVKVAGTTEWRPEQWQMPTQPIGGDHPGEPMPDGSGGVAAEGAGSA
ncbi:MAG: hypothetical protein PVI30_27450 [Myxococcales bacterium]|jgi:hypothetical protein